MTMRSYPLASHRTSLDSCSFWQELQRIVESASNDPIVRVIVLASAVEKAFTVGLDRERRIVSLAIAC